METPLEIIPYTSHYLNDVAQLYHSGFSGKEWGGIYTKAYLLEHIAEWMCDDSCRCYVAVSGSVVPGSTASRGRSVIGYRIGYAHASTMPHYFEELGAREDVERILQHCLIKPEDVFWLDDLVIGASWRGKGYGSRLVKHHVLPTALAFGYKYVFLYTLEGDVQLAKFYERLGFTAVGNFLDHLSQKRQVVFVKVLGEAS